MRLIKPSSCLFLSLTVVAAVSAGAQDYLVKDGKSPYTIVLSPSASPSEKTAATELQTHIKACTGAELPIAAAAVDGPMLVLGCGPVAQKLGVAPKPEALGEQGYVMRTSGRNLVIAGTAAAGTLYGAYDFIEEQLGVRWYAPDETRLPQVKDLALPPVDKTVKPAFAWRHTSYTWPGGDDTFRARQGENSGKGGPDCPLGVQYDFDGRCHSYYTFISPEEFFPTHPEYFSEIGGVRRNIEPQLCLTNPEVLDVVTERMLKRMADMPGVRQHNFSQMDWYNYCQCEKCTAINNQYGTPGATQYWFINQLAERTSKVYPDKLIGTLAYMYTEEVPKGMKLHPNVAVWLCHMYPSCDSHPIATCPLNADYKRRAEGWSKLCKHLYIWHYVVDFAHYYEPFPNFDAMAADMRFYKQIGVEGIYLQAMGHTGGGGEFSLLRPWYGMKLLENPDQDSQTLLRDFLDGYYGPAGKPLYQYVRLLHDKVKNDNVHMHLYTNPAQGYLPDEVLATAEALFEEAEAAVQGDEQMLERVRVARMPLVYARLFPRNGYRIEDGKLLFNGEPPSVDAAVTMLDRMQKHGFQTIREHGGDPQQLVMLSMLLNTPVTLPSLSNDFLTVEVAPVFGGRVLRIIDKKTGQCATAQNVTRCLLYPFQGGEETRQGSIFDLTSMLLPYTLGDRSDLSLTLTAQDGDIAFERTITLSPDAPVVTISAKATNAGSKQRDAQLRSHLELDLGNLNKTTLEFVNRAGNKTERTMQPIIANKREGEHFLDQNAPRGQWTFTGAKGLKVTQRFDDAAADFGWVYAFPADVNDLEVEVWGKPAKLAPGAATEFSHSIEVTSN